MLAGFCPVEGYSEDIAKFIVIGALGTVFPCLNWIKHFRKKKPHVIPYNFEKYLPCYRNQLSSNNPITFDTQTKIYNKHQNFHLIRPSLNQTAITLPPIRKVQLSRDMCSCALCDTVWHVHCALCNRHWHVQCAVQQVIISCSSRHPVAWETLDRTRQGKYFKSKRTLYVVQFTLSKLCSPQGRLQHTLLCK